MEEEEVRPPVLEEAPSGRAKCRGCGLKIDKGALRFGEVVENPFGDGDTTLWFHPVCAAMRRPDAFQHLSDEAGAKLEDLAALRAWVAPGLEFHRLPRIKKAEAAPTGRAKCRHCKEMIPKESWRFALEFWEDARFTPMGFIHAACAASYFGTSESVVARAQLPESLSEGAISSLNAILAEHPSGTISAAEETPN